ncbi:cysteine-rich VLP protein [Bacillus sp. THAF10]|uniref:cysteine-rich VLP protein n=1 Tax=Bacillus sp. THAF10 TaxID=2587848 RepID=UPI0015628472|nr:cysteine-rich VLP protein [Bacillus sp. THAF10]
MKKKIKKLVVSNCANYTNGNCVLLDKKCPIVIGGSYRGNDIPPSDCSCSYFTTSVLPIDKAIEAQYYGRPTQDKKKCKSCGTQFATASNRATYCGDSCRKSARNKTHIKYNQNRVK